MDSVKEKLAELLNAIDGVCPKDASCYDCEYKNVTHCAIPAKADFLIANGVTFATDNNVGDKWISVEDGLPKLILCNAGAAYSEAVNVLTTGRKVLTAIWDGFDWICDAAFWDAEGEEITHWTPVLFPLPQPTKGE